MDHELKSQDKVLALCAATGAAHYVNAIGGMHLYSRDSFRAQAVDLQFIQPKEFEYPQLGGPFVPRLSIIDTLMLNGSANTRAMLVECDLVEMIEDNY